MTPCICKVSLGVIVKTPKMFKGKRDLSVEYHSYHFYDTYDTYDTLVSKSDLI